MSIPGISSGGGDISPDLSAESGNTGGTNSLGGFSFGDYKTPTNWTPLIVVVVVLLVLWFVINRKKRR